MLELSSVDIHYAVQELQQLVGAKVEKIFQSDAQKRDLFFLLYLQNSPKVQLRFLLPGVICRTKEKPEYPAQPPGFAMFLRKYLSGVRLEKVEQHGFDRIIKMTFASKTATYTLVTELMAPSNMLLLDTEGRIINLLENQSFKDRALRARQPYALPPSTNIKDMTDDELAHRITVSTRESIVTTLAIACSLGGIYAEEVCSRAGIAKHRNDLSAEEVRAIVRALREILNQPVQAHKDDRRAYPFKLASKESSACEETSFLFAISEFIGEDPLQDRQEKKQQERSAPKNKLQSIIDAQRQQITKFEQEIKETQRKGERIFEEYQTMQEILLAAKEAREKKHDITHALKRYSHVKSYNTATGEVEIELDET
jgi:predicted ribosome quality control (RQC) complex YloA/Tae2 family protein